MSTAAFPVAFANLHSIRATRSSSVDAELNLCKCKESNYPIPQVVDEEQPGCLTNRCARSSKSTPQPLSELLNSRAQTRSLPEAQTLRVHFGAGSIEDSTLFHSVGDFH